MSNRHRFLVSYDIADSSRLRKVHSAVKGFGYPLQFSVYICDLTEREQIKLRWELRDVIDDGKDRIAFIDLGNPNDRGTTCFEFMGVRPNLPVDGSPTIL